MERRRALDGKLVKHYGINGPLVTVKGKTDLKMSEMVYVGKEKLVGEVIRLSPELATIQVFEETSGLKPGELLYPTGRNTFCYPGTRHRVQYL